MEVIAIKTKNIWYPKKAKSIEESSVRKELVTEIILKILYVYGSMRGMGISQILKVPFSWIENELDNLKKNELIGVVGGSGIGGYEGMDYSLTVKGRGYASDIYRFRSYIGPIPVTLSEYLKSIKRQLISTVNISEDKLKAITNDMVISEDLIDRVGPAINSGGPIFFYGKPGNGKTYLIEHFAKLFKQGIFIPHTIEVDGQIIRIFDEKCHTQITESDEKNYRVIREIEKTIDPRWAYVYRPCVVVGGELNLEMLDLIYKENINFYEAPFQLKANCGILLIDDFGRQLVQPRELLNRWIYPMEKGLDYLTLVTGKKIEVPFNQLLFFSTNLNPGDLIDEAFWRRINYKIEIKDPSIEEFKKIFIDCCTFKKIEFNEEIFNYMLKKHYHNKQREFRCCHPRDLIRHLVDLINYFQKPRSMSKELIDRACTTYFVD
ncbi:MAG: ATP-binding protein [Oligoflexia bacterium]|nr:ATP-binding protein [Oligoflexia bacterium]